MLLFWISIALITLTTLWLLWRPLTSRSALEMESVQQRNIAIAGERANEINSAFDTGEISAAERDQAMQDLEMSLADELASTQDLEDQFRQASRPGSLLILVLIPLLAFASYSLTSNFQSDREVAEQQQPTGEALPLADVMAQLEAAVEANPGDQRGLFLLARSYAQLGAFDKAARRFEQLLAIAEPDADLLVSYVDASAMANGRRFDEKMLANLDKALALNPNHVSGLWLAGLANQQFGRPEAALRHWLRLQPALAGNPEANQELTLLINSARDQLSGDRIQALETELAATQTESTPATTDAGVAAASVRVRVSLAASLQAEAGDSDTVFIFARAASGPPMPLAAVRQPVSALPLTLTLDDSIAMTPQMKLSAFRDVVVGARISKSGQATAQPGDLESELVATVNDNPEVIELLISKRRQ